jgi:hypothetical protein
MIHPTFRTLARFDEDTLSPSRRARVAEHLARCSRCFATVKDLRDIREGILRLTPPEPQEDLWIGIEERLKAGERLLLPVHSQPSRRHRLRGWKVAAAVAAGLLALAFWLDAPELDAAASELQIRPLRPQPGALIEVEYRGSGKLDEDGPLVLRAKLPSRDNLVTGDLTEVATLTRHGRVFRGSFTLPEEVRYAVLAVETRGGESVDHDPLNWEIVFHSPDGIPLLASLRAQEWHRLLVDTDRAHATAREMVRLYPDSIEAWRSLYFRETAFAGETEREKLRERYRRIFQEKLTPVLLAMPEPDPGTLWVASMYANEVGDTAASRQWREVLIQRHPGSPAAVQQQVFQISDLHRDPAGRLQAFEELFREFGASTPQLVFDGFRNARRLGDPETRPP